MKTKPIIKFTISVLLLFATVSAKAVTYTYNWTGTSSTVWAFAGNWTSTPGGGTYPGTAASDIVQIGVVAFAGSQPTLSAAPATAVASITLGSATNATLTISNPIAFTVTGAVTINTGSSWNETAACTPTFEGGIANSGTFTDGGGVHTFNTNSQALSGTLSIASVTVTGGAVVLTNNGTLTVGTALAGTGSLTNAATGTLILGGTFAAAINTAAAGNTVNYSGTGQTLKVQAYSNLILSGGAENFGAIITINSNLTLSGSATATLGGNLAITGNLTVGDGCTFTVPNVTLGVTGTTTIGNGLSGSLVKSAGAGTALTFTGAVTINGGGSLTESVAAALNFGAGGVTNNGTLTEFGAALVGFAGNFTNTGTYTASTGLHTFTGGGILAGIISIPSVTINAAFTNNGVLTVTTAFAGASTLTNGATGVLDIAFAWGGAAPTLNVATAGNTVNYCFAGAQNIFAIAYQNLTLSNSGVKAFQSSAFNVSGCLTISDNAQASMATYSLTTGTLSLGGSGQLNGTFGGTGSGATYINTTYFFATTGILTVTASSALGTWTGAISTDWNTAGNWSGLAVPTATTDVIIPGTATAPTQPTIGIAGGLCRNITISNTATLTMGGTYSLTVSGNWINNGGTFTASTSTVTFKGTTQTIGGSGSTTFNNLTTSGSTVITTGVATTISGNLTVADGTTFNVGAFALNVSGTTTVGTASSGILTINNAAGACTFTGALTINSGAALTETAAAPLVFGNDVTITGTLTENGAATASFAGNLTVNGTYTASTGVHTFSGTLKNFSGSVLITIPSVAITGSYTNNVALTVSTALSGGGSLTQAASATRAAGVTLNLGGTSTITTLTANGAYNTVNYYKAGAQTINATTTAYYNLILSGSGAKTLVAATISADSLSLSGTATAITVVGMAIGGGSPGGLSVGNNTTFTVAGFALTVNGPTIVGYGTSGTLTINNVAGGAKVFNGTVTINLGALLNETVASAITFGSDVNNYGTLTESGAAAVGFAGNFTNNGAYNSTTGMHTFSGTAKNLYGTIAYATGNATISGTYTNNGTFTVSNAFAGGGTLQNGATGILNINFAWGAVTPVLDASTYPGNTVSYGNNGAQTVQAVNYYNLTLTSVAAGIKTIAGAGTIAINGLLSITGSATANVGASTTSTANMLSLAGVGKAAGTWGSTVSTATNKNAAFGVVSSGYITISVTYAVLGTWSGATSTDWNVATNWSGSTVPVATTNVTINAGGNQPNIGTSGVCASITIGVGASLALTGTSTLNVSGNWSNSGTFTCNQSTVTFNATAAQTITGNTSFYNLTINAGSSTSIATNTTVSVAGNFTNSGTFTATLASTYLNFNGSGTSVVSGGGACTFGSANAHSGVIELNMASAAAEVDVQSANFISGINSGLHYNFIFTMGIWYMDPLLGSCTLNDCYNDGAVLANSTYPLTIPYGVTIEVGDPVAHTGPIMNLAMKGTSQWNPAIVSYVVLSGELLVNGGTVNVMGNNGNGYDFRYEVNGGLPELKVTGGTLNIGSGFNPNNPNVGAGQDYMDFEMTGGTIDFGFNTPSHLFTFQVVNNANSRTYMTAGTIVFHQTCISTTDPDIDFGGPLIGYYNVTGGTIQFGDPTNAQNMGGVGSMSFAFVPYSGSYYPNIVVWNDANSNYLCPIQSGDFGFYSLTLGGPNAHFDIKDWNNGTLIKNMTLYGNDGTYAYNNNGGTFIPEQSTIIFTGSLPQQINNSTGSETFYAVTVNKTESSTVKGGGSLSSLTISNPNAANVDLFWVEDGMFSPGTLTSMTIGKAGVVANTTVCQIDNGGTFNAPTNIYVNGSWTVNSGGVFNCYYNANPSTVTFTNTTAQQINGTATSQAFYNLTIGGIGSVAVAGASSPSTVKVEKNFYEQSASFAAPSTVFDVLGNITLQGGTTFTAQPLSNIYLGGNWVNNGASFIPSTSTVTFDTTMNQSIMGTACTQTFYGLTLNNMGAAGSNILTLGGGCNNVVVNSMLTMLAGVFNVSTNKLNGSGGLAFPSGTAELQMADITPADQPLPGLTGNTYNCGSYGTVTLNGAGNQTLRTSATSDGTTYYNLNFYNSGIKTLGSGVTHLKTINGNVNVTGSATLNNFYNGLTQAAAMTFTYSSSGATSVDAGSAVTVGNYVQTSGTFTLPGNATNTFTISGASWNKSGGTFTSTTPSSVIFNSASAQTFTDNGTVFSNVTVNNTNGLTLNNSMSISANLNFQAGTASLINTGSNNVIITADGATVTNASQANGYVNGNMTWDCTTSGAKTFTIGSGGEYAPINFTSFSANPGTVSCSTTIGNDPNINSSLLDPTLTVMRYWNISSSNTPTFNATFNYTVADVSAGATPANFAAQTYDGTNWSTLTISGSPTDTTTSISGATGTTYSNDYAIGMIKVVSGVYNANNGSINWNNQANWVRYKTEGITITSVGQLSIVGAGFTAVDNLVAGNVLVSKTNPGTPLGTIASVTNTTITLQAPGATAIYSGSYGIQCIPTTTDVVNIGNPFISVPAAVTVTLDVSPSIFELVFTSMGYSNTLNNSTFTLTTSNNVIINQPNVAGTNQWNVNAGNASIAGNLQIGGGVDGASKISVVDITTGAITVGTDLVFYSSTGNANNAVMNITGAGTLNLGGAGTAAMTLTNTGNKFGTFNPGASSIVNYNSSTSSQTVNFTTIAPAVTYANLSFNNTSASGATITTAISSANVTGTVRVQTGLFQYGTGMSASGTGTFEVDNGATFEMTSTATFPVFTHYNFGVSSTTQYFQNSGITVNENPTYGNLMLEPSANSINFTLGSGSTINVAGNLTVGNGANTGVNIDALSNDEAITVNGNLTINPNSTLIADPMGSPITLNGNWINNGGTFTSGGSGGYVVFSGANQFIEGTAASQTFGNVTINETAGSTLTTGGSTTTLNVYSITQNSGIFTSPNILNITQNMSLAGTCTFNAGPLATSATNINIGGSWSEASSTTVFNANEGTITFNGSSLVTTQKIHGGIPSEQYYNFVINNTGLGVDASAFNNLSTQNFTMTDGNFIAPTTFSVLGTLTQNAGTFSIDNGYQLNVGGNWFFNGGSLSFGATSLVQINGTTTQTIGGTVPYPSIPNLTITNTYQPSKSAITLNSPITVSSVLTLLSGDIVTNGTNFLSLNTGGAGVVTVYFDNAPHSAVYNDSSYVNGPMYNYVNQSGGPLDLIFPVGASIPVGSFMNRMDLNLTSTFAQSIGYFCQFIVANANNMFGGNPGNVQAPLTNVSQYGYWEFQMTKTTNTYSLSTINLYYNNFFDVPTPSVTHVATAEGWGGPWKDYGGIGTTACSGLVTCVGSVLSTTGFSSKTDYFTISSSSSPATPLPIELLYFNAQCETSNTKLIWATASETNNDYFSVEKSHDGSTFENIGNVAGAGFSNTLLPYSLIDDNPYSDITYYRLKQTDFNGNFTYSDIISSSCGYEAHISMIVSQTENGIYLSINPGNSKNLALSIFDITGRMIYYKHINTKDNPLIISPDIFSTGIYLFRLQSETQSIVQKVMMR